MKVGGRCYGIHTSFICSQKDETGDSDMALLGHHPSKPLDLNTALVILSHDAVLEKCSMRYHL